MAEDVKREKKKVYVETTVVSDAALPASKPKSQSWELKRKEEG